MKIWAYVAGVGRKEYLFLLIQEREGGLYYPVPFIKFKWKNKRYIIRMDYIRRGFVLAEIYSYHNFPADRIKVKHFVEGTKIYFHDLLRDLQRKGLVV